MRPASILRQSTDRVLCMGAWLAAAQELPKLAAGHSPCLPINPPLVESWHTDIRKASALPFVAAARPIQTR